MLDVKKEIQDLLKDGQSGNAFDKAGGLINIINTYNSNMDRMGRTQFRYSSQMEEIISILDEIGGDRKALNDYRNTYEGSKKEIASVISAVLKASDALEDVCRYAVKYGENAWKKQLSVQWTSLGDYLAGMGFSRIDTEGAIFNVELHKAAHTFCRPGCADNSVLEIIRCGYAYKGRILRKAEVVVNKIPAGIPAGKNQGNKYKREWRPYNDSRNRPGDFNIGNRFFKGRKAGCYRKPGG